MGILWSLLGVGTSAPRPLKPIDRIRPIVEQHWRGILGSIVPIVLIPLASKKPADMCMYVWACMALLWIIQPFPLPVTGSIPIFAFPMLGIINTGDTCKCYLNDMSAMLITGSMMWSLLNYTKIDKRFFCWLMKIAGPSHPTLLLAICVSSALLSMVTLKMLVVAMMMPIVEELLIKMESVGQEAPYTTKTTPPDLPVTSANKLASIYYLAVGSSAAIGSIGFINSSMVTLTFLAQVETQYPRLKEEFCYPRFAMFTIPIMIVMLILNYAYLLILLRPASRKISPAGRLTIRTFLKEKHASLGGWNFHQWVATLSMFVLVLLLLLRYPVGFSGWGKIVQDYMVTAEELKRQPRYIRDSTVFALFVVVLHSIPADTELLKYFKYNQKSKLPPVKARPSVMTWPESNKNTPWAYLFMLGGAVALIHGSKKSGLSETFSNWAHTLDKVPWAVVLLILVLFVVAFANVVSFVAACGILMPILIHVGPAMNQCPLFPALALGLACSLTFTLPYADTPPSVVKSLGKVRTKRLILYGAVSAVICAIVLYVALLVYSGTIWSCEGSDDWGEDVLEETAETTTTTTSTTETPAATPPAATPDAGE